MQWWIQGFEGQRAVKIKGHHMYPSRKSTSDLINNILCKKCDLLFSSNLVHRVPAIYIYLIYFYFTYLDAVLEDITFELKSNHCTSWEIIKL